MDGRLGNQFFRYAFAQQLKKYNPQETIIYNFGIIFIANMLKKAMVRKIL